MDNNKIDKKLKNFKQEELYDLIQSLRGRDKNLDQYILEEICGNQNDKDLEEQLILEYWEKAQAIISKFNSLGGGPYSKEQEGVNYIYDIIDIIEMSEQLLISRDIKYTIIDEVIAEYKISNSGFDDTLIELSFAICNIDEDWEYLINKLKKNPSRWDKNLIMQIYKDCLNDDKAYLKERKKNLEYGMDYWELAEFFINKEERKRSIDIVKTGIIKGKGRKDELFDYYFDYHAKKDNTENLEWLLKIAINNKTDAKYILEKLFSYYKDQNNYIEGRRVLNKLINYLFKKDYFEYYIKVKTFLKPSDLKGLEEKIIKKAYEHNLNDCLKIYLDKGEKRKVMTTILDQVNTNNFYNIIHGDLDIFVEKLKEKFPNDAINYYWKKSLCYIFKTNRSSYKEAAKYLLKVKKIYINIVNNEKEWNARFISLKNKYSTRPAFQDEVSHL